MCSSDIFLGLIAILFPPIAGKPFTSTTTPKPYSILTDLRTVWVKRGVCSADSLINIALCCLGFLPGLLHAWYIISKYPETDYDRLPQDGGERGTVHHYHVCDRSGGDRQRQNKGYGTNDTMQASPQQDPPRENAGESSAGGVPPSYDQAVKGDHKVQV